MRFAAVSLVFLSAASSVLSLPTTRFSSYNQRRAQIARLQAIQKRAANAPAPVLVAVERDEAQPVLAAAASTTSPTPSPTPTHHHTTEAEVYAAEVAALTKAKPKKESHKKDKPHHAPRDLPTVGSESESTAAYEAGVEALKANDEAPTPVIVQAWAVGATPVVDNPQIGGEFAEWAAAEGQAAYVHWFPPRLTTRSCRAACRPAERLRRALPTIAVTLTTQVPATVRATLVPAVVSGKSTYANALLVHSAKTTVKSVAKGTTTQVIKTINILAYVLA